MTDREALRIAFACAIDTAHNLPKCKLRDRVTEAARIIGAQLLVAQERDPTFVRPGRNT